MLDVSLKPEADRLNNIAIGIITELRHKCEELAKELDQANENVRNQEKTDARENADLQIARERQAMVNHANITTQRQLSALSSCIEGYVPKGSVTLGTTLELKLLTVNGDAPVVKKTTYIVKIVEHDASDAENGFIAQDCKVGLACLGKVAGDIITVKAPMGALQYKIERIY